MLVLCHQHTCDQLLLHCIYKSEPASAHAQQPSTAHLNLSCMKAVGIDSLAYVHLGSADVPIQERCKRVCLLSLIPPHQEDLADCPACTQLTADRAYNDFSGLLIVIEVHITRQSYLIGDMSNKQSHNQAWWRWTIDNFREHGFEVSAWCPWLLKTRAVTSLASLCGSARLSHNS